MNGSTRLADDLKRVGIHHVVLQPGERSSRPHAESHEEEFVYVIEGNPHAWINGWLYELKEGHFVGFPAGTGIFHTFLNNTNKPVRLLVGGERTKKENLCAFLFNPEMKSDPIWWEDYPPQKLGPHNGQPGPTKSSDFATEPSPYIFYAPDAERTGWAYPGDNLTGSDYVAVTDHIGLKVFGIGHEVLRPGRTSSYAHAHTHEEEFVYILRGNPELWLDGHRKKMKPGDWASFVPMSGVSHCLLNETEEDVLFIVVGERTQFPDEKIIYPMHPLRNDEMRRRNSFWENAPRLKNFGTEPAWPHKIVPSRLRLRYPNSDQEVLEIFEASKTYFQRINGADPTLATVRTEKADAPSTKSPTWFKEFLVIEIEGKAAGVCDLQNNHPDSGITFLGLLLLREDYFGRGFGREAYRIIEDYVRRANGAKKIRIGISDDNDVSGYWKKMGFAPNGHTFEWKGEKKTSQVKVYDKSL